MQILLRNFKNAKVHSLSQMHNPLSKLLVGGINITDVEKK